MKKDSIIHFDKWALMLSKEEAGFYQCFTLCYDDLYRLGLYLYKDPELVKECIQLLFIELWKIKDRLEEVKNIKEYTLTIFKRILYKQKNGLVKHWSIIAMVDNNTCFDELYTESYEEMLIQHQDSESKRNKLLKILPHLSERQKELIRMRYFEEKSIEEIAAITTLSSRTIYNTLHNALGKLKDLMG